MIPLFRSAAHRLSASHHHRPLHLLLRSLSQQQAVQTLEPVPSDNRPSPSPIVSRLVDEIASLTQTEICDLCRIICEKTGQQPPTVAVMGAGGGIGMRAGTAGPAEEKKEEKKEEKTVFELKLEGFDASSKIKVIKEVRGFTDLGLKEAKDLVEKAPVVIKGGLSKEEGKALMEKMQAVGAKVVLE